MGRDVGEFSNKVISKGVIRLNTSQKGFNQDRVSANELCRLSNDDCDDKQAK